MVAPRRSRVRVMAGGRSRSPGWCQYPDPRVCTRRRRAGAAYLADVRAALPDLRLLTDEIDRESYRRDETAYLEPPLPIAVALPTTTAEVAELVRLAAAHRVPVVPRGAGTGLSGGAVGVEGGITIAFTRMDRVLEIDRENLVVVTQPGIVNADLKKAVAAEGLFYAPDPASYETCTIGGNLGTNAGGLCCIKYGVTRDSVVGLEIVRADGSVVRLGGRTTKDVAGYGLIPLIVGSQGTLAVITEATLRLRPTPPPKQTLIAFFPSLDAAGRAVVGAVRGGRRAVHARAHGSHDDPGGRRRPRARARPRRRRDADDRVRPARRRGRPGARDRRPGLRLGRCQCDRHRGGCPGGRLAAPGPPDGVPRDGAPRCRPDGGRRRAARPRPGAAGRDRAGRRGAGPRDRDLRPRRRRQPPPEHHPGPRRPRRRGEAPPGHRCALSRRDRARRDRHGRTRHRRRPARLPRPPARRGRASR